MKYEEYPTDHPAPEFLASSLEALPGNVILGETAYSPGDRAVTLWPFYDPALPVNVMTIGETACGPDYHVIRPRSRIMAIEYIAQGAGILTINGQAYRPEQNCAILLTKHSAHSYAADPQNPWQKHWIVFDGPFMQNMIDSYLPKNSYCFANCNLLPYFHEIRRCVQAQKKDYPRLLESLTVILLQMVLQMNRVVTQREASLPEKIRAAIDAQIEGKLSLETICAEFSYSKNHIITLFRNEYGITPYRYFEKKKIEVAKLYLCNTSFTIDEVAQHLSYADRNYFSNCFKKHTGYAPAEYRRKHGFS